MEKLKRWLKTRSIRWYYGASAVLILLSGFLVYYFSPDSRVQVLAAEGNYLFSDTQIYQMAGVNTSTRIWLTPGFWLSHKVESNPLVVSCKTVKSGHKITFEVSEKTIIGYYIQDGKDYMLSVDGESVEIDPAYLRSILHFPLLSDFTSDQLKQIAQAFHDNPEYLDRDVTAQIAEIIPYKSSYDDNMLRITMQDGNVVFSSMDDLVMMTHYEDMLQQLRGQSVCLLLDKENSAINKVACDYLNMSQEEREAYRQQLKAEQEQKAAQEAADKEKEAASSDKKETTEGTGESGQGDQTAPDRNETDQDQTASGLPADLDSIEDWEATDIFDYQYSPSQDLYYDPHQNIYLRWDEASQDFTLVE